MSVEAAKGVCPCQLRLTLSSPSFVPSLALLLMRLALPDSCPELPRHFVRVQNKNASIDTTSKVCKLCLSLLREHLPTSTVSHWIWS